MKIQSKWKRSLTVAALNLAAGVGLAQSGADSGWTWQNPRPTGTLLRGVAALDSNTTIAVGAQGAILRTTDGGATWKPQTTGSNRALYGVFFIDANTGWAVGEGGTILHTTTGGEPFHSEEK